MNQPLVTILVPTYKRPALLREAVESAKAQTYQNTEILILDNASPDNTPEVAQELADSDKRIRYVRHPKDTGITGNWHYGMTHMQGKYFTLLHDDDTMEPGFVAALVPPMEADETLSVAFTDHYAMTADGTRSLERTEELSAVYGRAALPAGRLADFARDGVLVGAVPIVASLYRRSLLDPEVCVSKEAKGSSDLWLIYSASRAGGGYFVKERLVNYRMHGGMSSTQPIYMAEGKIFCLNAMVSDPGMAHLRKELRSLIAGAWVQTGIGYLRQGNPEKARTALSQSLQSEPQLRGVVGIALSYTGAVGTRIANRLRSA